MQDCWVIKAEIEIVNFAREAGNRKQETHREVCPEFIFKNKRIGIYFLHLHTDFKYVKVIQ